MYKKKSKKTARRASIAVDEGRNRKADRLFKKAARQENREIIREERKAKRKKIFK